MWFNRIRLSGVARCFGNMAEATTGRFGHLKDIGVGPGVLARAC